MSTTTKVTAEEHANLHVDIPDCCMIFTKTRTSKHFLIKLPNVRFHENLSNRFLGIYDYHLFPELKKHLGETHFRTGEELKEEVLSYLRIDLNGDYVEK
jgi:hypothetical protein